MLSLLVFFLLLSLALGLFKPTAFVVFYLLASTKFLGLFDYENYFVISGFSVGFPLLNLVAFVCGLIKKDIYVLPPVSLKLLAFFFAFLSFGLLFPIALGLENIAQSIIAGKEFLTISIFLYLVAFRRVISSDLIIKAIKYIGVYLALSYMAFYSFNIYAPFYYDGSIYRAYYPTYISFSAFLYFADLYMMRFKGPQKFLMLTLLVTGVFLAGHDALAFSTVVLLFGGYLFLKNNRFITLKNIVAAIFLGIALILTALDPAINSKVQSYFSDSNPAISSRSAYNEFRWDAINDRPLFGYGFIHKSASITDQYVVFEGSKFASKFDVIDSGYVDIFIKFGFLGGVIYVVGWLYFIVQGSLNMRGMGDISIIVGLFLFQYFLVNYTWSVMTFSHGLIPAFIAFYLLLMGNKHRLTTG